MPDSADVAEDYGLNRIADNVITLGRGHHEQRNRQLILTLTDARNVESGFSELYLLDYPRMRMTMVHANVQGYNTDD